MSFKGRRYAGSKYLKKWHVKNEALSKSPEFRKELKQLRGRTTIFKSKMSYEKFLKDRGVEDPIRYCLLFEGKARAKRWLGNPEEWDAFEKKWGIESALDLALSKRSYKIKTKMPVVMMYGYDKDEKLSKPALLINTKDVVEQDIKDCIPWLMEEKEKLLGKSPQKQGRKKTTGKRNKDIYREVVSRLANGEKLKHVFSSIAWHKRISSAAIRDIYYKEKRRIKSTT